MSNTADNEGERQTTQVVPSDSTAEPAGRRAAHDTVAGSSNEKEPEAQQLVPDTEKSPVASTPRKPDAISASSSSNSSSTPTTPTTPAPAIGRNNPWSTATPTSGNRTVPGSAESSKSSRGRAPPVERRRLTPLEEKALDPELNVLPDNSIESFAKYLIANKCSNIIVMTGAGVSTSAGIPDFRTPGTGLYDNLAKYKLPFPQAIFDISYFRRRPQAFYELSRELFPGKFKPTPCHYFIKQLDEHGMLLRNYTQNIDMLERLAGVRDKALVEAHGSFHVARCIGGMLAGSPSQFESDSDESDQASGKDDDDDDDDGNRKDAVESNTTETSRDTDKPTNNHNEPYLSQDEGIEPCGRTYTIEEFKAALADASIVRCVCGGLVKPDIVFFGESLPELFHRQVPRDFGKCDALIVIGTSLQVQPFASLVNLVGPKVPRLLINREVVGAFDFDGSRHKYRRDALFLGTCDDGAFELAAALGFELTASAAHENAASEQGQPPDSDVEDVANLIGSLSVK